MIRALTPKNSREFGSRGIVVRLNSTCVEGMAARADRMLAGWSGNRYSVLLVSSVHPAGSNQPGRLQSRVDEEDFTTEDTENPLFSTLCVTNGKNLRVLRK